MNFVNNAITGAEIASRIYHHLQRNKRYTGRYSGVNNALTHPANSVIARASRMARRDKRSRRLSAPAGKKRIMNSTSNTTKAVARIVKRGASGHSSGPTMNGKIRSKRLRRDVSSRMTNGVQITEEVGQVLTTTEVQYIGHITHPQVRVLTQMWSAVVKLLWQKIGYAFDTLDQTCPSLAVTDQVVLQYTSGTNVAPSQIVFAVGANASIRSVVNQIMGSSIYSGGSLVQQELNFISIQYACTAYNPFANTASMNLNLLRLRTYVKSSLKMQNRSFTVATNDTSEDVDNVPLYGKVYAGKGTGARLKTVNAVNVTLFGSTSTGLITANAGTVNALQEPPSPHLFLEVSKGGKVAIEPGTIKTSVLVDKQFSLFNLIHSSIMQYNIGNNYVKRRIGKFQFMAMEKLLDAQNITNTINIAIEHNWFMSCQAYDRKTYATSAYFNKTYL